MRELRKQTYGAPKNKKKWVPIQPPHSVSNREGCDGDLDHNRGGLNPRTLVALAALTKRLGC